MRLWSLHPAHLDARGLVALWREGLLAQAVLKGATRGYVHHPQLHRFRRTASPVQAVSAYLRVVHEEACRRHYCFDATRLEAVEGQPSFGLTVTTGQLAFEWQRLVDKVALRDPAWHRHLSCTVKAPRPHPMFRLVEGDVEAWEKAPRTDAPVAVAKARGRRG